MTRTIAALSIALVVIAAGTQSKAEAQSGMTVETVYLFLAEEEFEEEESDGDHYYSASYRLNEITWAAWERGTVMVQKCAQEEGAGAARRVLQTGIPADIDPDAQRLLCKPLGPDMDFHWSQYGMFSVTHDRADAGSSRIQARQELLVEIALFPILRVTIIAPAY